MKKGIDNNVPTRHKFLELMNSEALCFSTFFHGRFVNENSRKIRTKEILP